jgi:hypothetical protein
LLLWAPQSALFGPPGTQTPPSAFAWLLQTSLNQVLP